MLRDRNVYPLKIVNMDDRLLHWRVSASGIGGLRLDAEGADLRLDMQRTAHDVWRAALPPLSSGKWYLEVGNERWRLSAPLWFPAKAEEIAISAQSAGE